MSDSTTEAAKPAAKRSPAKKAAPKKAPTTQAKSATAPDLKPEPAVNNLRIWEKGQETPPSATKEPEPGSGIHGTTVNGLAMMKRATEIFGPVGIGFGFIINEERFDNAAPIVEGGAVIGNYQMHTILVTLWYIDPETKQKGQVSHFGHTPFVFHTKYGVRSDFEAPKKSLTDAMKKCLSNVGVFADVYLGMFESTEYVEAAKVKETIAKATHKAEAQEAAVGEFSAWVANQAAGYAKVPNAASLTRVFKRNCAEVELRVPGLGLNYFKIEEKLYKPYMEQLDKLRPPVECVCNSCGVSVVGQPKHHCPECGSRFALDVMPQEPETQTEG